MLEIMCFLPPTFNTSACVPSSHRATISLYVFFFPSPYLRPPFPSCCTSSFIAVLGEQWLSISIKSPSPMQYLWALTFVARQGSLRWPRGLAHGEVRGITDTITHHPSRKLSPTSSAQRYSSSCDRSKLRALLLQRKVSEWFMVIYVVGHACCRLVLQLVPCNLLF